MNSKKGGIRAGAGRPKKEPTEVWNFRYNTHQKNWLKIIYKKTINKKVKQFLDKLYNDSINEKFNDLTNI